MRLPQRDHQDLHYDPGAYLCPLLAEGLSQLISGRLWIFHVLVLTPDFSICSLALYIWDHYF